MHSVLSLLSKRSVFAMALAGALSAGLAHAHVSLDSPDGGETLAAGKG